MLTLPTPTDASGPERLHLSINIELGTAVFTKQFCYANNGLDVPLFLGGLIPSGP